MKKENWIWMPHPGHFCAGSDCKFVMNTYVGGYIVSTVGEYVPSFITDGKFQKIGMNRLYETMVFEAVKSKDKCCPYQQRSGSEVDYEPYNDPGEARSGHLKLCNKWAKKS